MTEPRDTAPPDLPRAARAANPIYRALVRDDRDMIGHVAYALYKRDKLNFCESIASKHDRPVDTRDVEAFVHASQLPARIDAYRSEAETALQGFADEVLAEQLNEGLAEMQSKFTADLQRARSWPRAILENTIGNVLSLGVLALIAFLIFWYRFGLERAVSEPARAEPPVASSPAR